MTTLALEPAPAWPLATPAPTTLARCLVLAALLHVLLVLVLGNAPGGTARRGEGVWGDINVTLRGPAVGTAATAVPPAPEVQAGPPGDAPSIRYGGAVREVPLPVPPLPPSPGALKRGDWAPLPVPLAELRAADGPAPSSDLPPGPPPPPDRVSEERAMPRLAPARVAPDALPMPGPESVRAPALAPVPGPLPLVAPPVEPPPVLPPPLAPVPVAPPPALPVAPPPTVVPNEGPAAPPTLQSPLLRSIVRPPVAAPLEPVAPAVEPLRSLGNLAPLPAMPAPRPVPPAPPLPPAPVVARPPALDATPSIDALPAVAAPPAAVAAEPPPLPPQPLATLRRDKLPTPPQRESPLPNAAKAADVSSLPPLQALPPGPAPLAAAPPPVGAMPAVPGAPDAGPSVGHDVATAPSAPASAPPRLNLELPRQRGGELSRLSSPGVLQLLPRPPELPPKLARDIEKAAKDDCRTAYSGAGVLAVVPLAIDAVRQDGCKW